MRFDIETWTAVGRGLEVAVGAGLSAVGTVVAGSGLGVALGGGLAVAVAVAAIALAVGTALGVKLGWAVAVMGDVGFGDAGAAWLAAIGAAGVKRPNADSPASARPTSPPRITRRSGIGDDYTTGARLRGQVAAIPNVGAQGYLWGSEIGGISAGSTPSVRQWALRGTSAHGGLG